MKNRAEEDFLHFLFLDNRWQQSSTVVCRCGFKGQIKDGVSATRPNASFACACYLWHRFEKQFVTSNPVSVDKSPEKLNCDYSRGALHDSPFTPSETSTNSMLHNQQNGMTPPTEHVIFYMEDTFTVLYRAALLSFCSLTEEEGKKSSLQRGKLVIMALFVSPSKVMDTWTQWKIRQNCCL